MVQRGNPSPNVLVGAARRPNYGAERTLFPWAMAPSAFAAGRGGPTAVLRFGLEGSCASSTGAGAMRKESPASLCLTAPRGLAYTAALSYAKEGAQ